MTSGRWADRGFHCPLARALFLRNLFGRGGMACSRGKASPNGTTKLRLFADSAGFGHNPACLERLFIDVGATQLHIAEMAHIIAASDGGPRANVERSREDRGAYENLILLCANCHTKVDKAPRAFSDQKIHAWKAEHVHRVAAAFGVVEYADRPSARAAIEPLLQENRAIFQGYGPDLDYRFDPESEMAVAWKRKLLAYVLPNNQKLVRILDANRQYLTDSEAEVLENFRQHVDDLEHRHLSNEAKASGARFPVGMNTILSGDGGKTPR